MFPMPSSNAGPSNSASMTTRAMAKKGVGSLLKEVPTNEADGSLADLVEDEVFENGLLKEAIRSGGTARQLLQALEAMRDEEKKMTTAYAMLEQLEKSIGQSSMEVAEFWEGVLSWEVAREVKKGVSQEAALQTFNDAYPMVSVFADQGRKARDRLGPAYRSIHDLWGESKAKYMEEAGVLSSNALATSMVTLAKRYPKKQWVNAAELLARAAAERLSMGKGRGHNSRALTAGDVKLALNEEKMAELCQKEWRTVVDTLKKKGAYYHSRLDCWGVRQPESERDRRSSAGGVANLLQIAAQNIFTPSPSYRTRSTQHYERFDGDNITPSFGYAKTVQALRTQYKPSGAAVPELRAVDHSGFESTISFDAYDRRRQEVPSLDASRYTSRPAPGSFSSRRPSQSRTLGRTGGSLGFEGLSLGEPEFQSTPTRRGETIQQAQEEMRLGSSSVSLDSRDREILASGEVSDSSMVRGYSRAPSEQSSMTIRASPAPIMTPAQSAVMREIREETEDARSRQDARVHKPDEMLERAVRLDPNLKMPKLADINLHKKNCKCSEQFRAWCCGVLSQNVPDVKKAGGMERQRDLLCYFFDFRRSQSREEAAVLAAWAKDEYCWYHIKRMATILGLKTGRPTKDELLARLVSLYGRAISRTAGLFRSWRSSDGVYTWFTMAGRDRRADDDFGPYRLAPNPMFSSSSMIRTITPEVCEQLLSLAMPGGRAEVRRIREHFERDGSVLADPFAWLRTTDLVGYFRQEFDCYRWHQRSVNGRPNLGWLRTMLYSVTQQILRQDPIYYLLYVMLRPDHAAWLMSYPYYCKYQYLSLGEGVEENMSRAGFRHMDINLKDFVEQNRGANMLQGALSITPEAEDDCTTMVLGMHKHMQEWMDRILEREVANGVTQSQSYLKPAAPGKYVQNVSARELTPEDLQHFRVRWKPTPVTQPLGVRISHPAIPHGAQPGKNTRMALLPWPVKVEDDHHTMEVKDMGTWEDISAAHVHMRAPPLTPSGHSNRYGAIPYAFPASVQVQAATGLSEALVGRARFDAVPVQRDLHNLVDWGRIGDAVNFQKWLTDYRRDAEANVRAAFKTHMQLERACFGEDSFYRVRKRFHDRNEPLLWPKDAVTRDEDMEEVAEGEMENEEFREEDSKLSF